MFRYIAYTWNSADKIQREAAQLIATRLQGRKHLSMILQADGLRVFCTREQTKAQRCHLLQGGKGVVLGIIFHGCTSEASVCGRFSDSQTQQIVRTEGRHLIDAFWGSYVAFICAPEREKTWIIRSPRGALPCLMTEFRGVRLYYSYIPDYATLGLQRFSINWSYIAGHLVKKRQPGITGLVEVSELACGVCLELDRHQLLQRVYWDELSAALSTSIEDPTQAQEALRETTRAVTQAWGSCYDSLFLRLSGGLDSAILLSCLQNSPTRPHITCINRYSVGADGDERHFARLSARQACCDLLELQRTPTFRVEDMMTAELSEKPRPYLKLFGQALYETRLAREKNCGAILSGSFGDEVFGSVRPTMVVSDHIHRFGLHNGFAELALRAARLEGLSVWTLLRRALPMGLTAYKWDVVRANRPYNTLVNKEAIEAAHTSDLHAAPWFDENRYVPPGKQCQIRGLMHTEGYYLPFAAENNPEYVSPFNSQPLTELCLQIPMYMLMPGASNRELARRTFVGCVPTEILRRRSKGGQEEYTAEIFRLNIDFARDMLLNGQLVRRGFLNRDKLDEALSGKPSAVLQGMTKISKQLALEVWLSIWARHEARIAA